MRIGLFAGEFPHPAATAVMHRAVALLAHGHDVAIVAERPSCARVEHEEVREHGLHERVVLRDGGMRKAALRFDIVHAEGAGATGEAIRLRDDGVFDGPVISTLHRVAEYDERRHRNVDAIVVHTDAAAAELRRRGGPAERIHVVAPCVVVDRERASRRLRRRPRRLLTVATLDDGKRVQEIIRALAERAWPDVVHDVVGDGPSRGGLQQLALRLGVSERVRFHGWCSTRRVRAFMAAADLFVLPGRAASTLREAQAAALPVVASADPEVAEIVRHGDTGLLVARGDVATLGHAIEWLTSDEPSYRRMSLLAQQHAAERWDAARHLQQLVSLYAAVRRA